MELVAIVTGVALLEYVCMIVLVGRARGQHGVEAPAISGHPTFDRYFRVQQNTLEQLAIFLPGIWLFGYYLSAQLAAILGAVFVLGRAIYLISYVADPEKRGPGMLLTLLVNVILIVGGLIGALRAL